MVFIQPGHDAVALFRRHGFPACAHRAVPVRQTGVVVHHGQLPKHSHKAPLGPVLPGDERLRWIVIGVKYPHLNFLLFVFIRLLLGLCGFTQFSGIWLENFVYILVERIWKHVKQTTSYECHRHLFIV